MTKFTAFYLKGIIFNSDWNEPSDYTLNIVTLLL